MGTILNSSGVQWNNINKSLSADSNSLYLNVTQNNNCYIDGALQINGYVPSWNSSPISNYFTSSNNSRYAYLNNSGAVGKIDVNFTPPNNDGTNNSAFGLFVRHRIGCGDEIDVFSDERIKKDIVNIDSKDALIILRHIQPKTFKYIDNLKNSHNINYGFISQEIDKYFSDAISKIHEFIPNIYDFGIIKNKNTITLINVLTSNFKFDNIQEPLYIKLLINNKDIIVTLKEVIDNNTFMIDEDIIEEILDNKENKIFVYGQKVYDFHVLEKNAIFTVTTSAVKQLDIELNMSKKIIENQQEQLNSLQEQITELKKLILQRI